MKFQVTGFEHLHLHTDFSLLDGIGMVEEYSERASQINQKYLCITDHGMMGAVPRQIRATDKHNLTPIYGCELYCNPLQQSTKKIKNIDFQKDLSPDEIKIFRSSYHLLAIAITDKGYSNLVKLSSWGWIEGSYRKPRVNYDMLKKHKEGIIFTSCCYMSEIAQAFERGGSDLADEMLKTYSEMFEDQFYLEFMLLDFVKQKPYNEYIIGASERFNLPVILTNDCHYCYKEDSIMQQYSLMVKTKRTVKDIEEILRNNSSEDLLELQDKNLWMKSEEELNEKWFTDYKDIIPLEIFEEAKRNTVRICEMAKNVQLDRTLKMPEFDDADSILMDKIQRGIVHRNINIRDSRYQKRIMEEYNLISRKKYSTYFLIQQEMTDEARRKFSEVFGWGDGSEACGPGRGSAGGALTCYLLGITDVDPIKEDLLFERFLSPARGGKQYKIRFKDAELIDIE